MIDNFESQRNYLKNSWKLKYFVKACFEKYLKYYLDLEKEFKH